MMTGINYIEAERVIAMEKRYVLRNRLRVCRAERPISQEELALSAGVTRQTISAIENNQYVPSAQLAFLLALCLGKQVTEVFYLEEVTTHD